MADPNPKGFEAWANSLSNLGVLMVALSLSLVMVAFGVYMAHYLHKRDQAPLEGALQILASAQGQAVETLDLVARMAIDTSMEVAAIKAGPQPEDRVLEIERRLPAPPPHPKNYRPPQSIAQPPVPQKKKEARDWGILDDKIKAFDQSLTTEPPKE